MGDQWQGVHRYHVAYEYPAAPDTGARWLQGEDELGEKHFRRLKVGDPVAVLVCRTDPANHLLRGGRPRVFADARALPVVLGALATLALVGAVNLGWWWVCRRRWHGRHLFVLAGKGKVFPIL